MKQSEKVYTGSLNTLKPALNLLAAFALLTLTACGGGGGGGGSVGGPAPAHNIAQKAYLKATNTGAGDLFGTSMAVDGDTLVVGAPGGTGQVYVFTRDNAGEWIEQTILRASNADAFDQFGFSVALSGDTLVVGAPKEDGNRSSTVKNPNNGFTDAGAVYVFTRDSNGDWTQQAMLKAGNADPDDLFGFRVALDGGTLAVGAIEEDGASNNFYNAGAVYIFTRDNSGVWGNRTYIKASNTGAIDLFGISMALEGDTLVVGAIYEDGDESGNEDNSGAAYVFTRDSNGDWSEQAMLKASNAGANDQFGMNVALSGDTLVVGAELESGKDDGVPYGGAVYVFTGSGANWTEQAILRASNAGAGDFFGVRLTLSGDILAVSALYEDDVTVDSGAVYVFTRDNTGEWIEQAYLKANNTGWLDHFGVSVALDGDTVVVGANQEDGDDSGNEDISGAVYVFQ